MGGGLKVVFIILFIPAVLFSQNVRHLSIENGLPQSFVSGIVENKDGFIWLSTKNGLARFDGHNFKIFQHIEKNKKSLSSNIIDDIKQENNNSMWIKYGSGEIDKFNFIREEATPVIDLAFIEKNDLTISKKVWLIDHENTFWFKSSDGKLCSVPINDKKRITKYNTYFNKYGAVYNIIKTRKKELWCLSNDVISKYDRQTGKFTSIAFPDKLFSEPEGDMTAAFIERDNGELMWGSKTTMYFYNPEKKSFRKKSIPVNSLYPVQYIDKDLKGQEFFVRNKTVYSYSDVSGIVKAADIKIEILPHAFLVDRTGLFWTSGNVDGVFVIDTSVDCESFDYDEDFAVDLLKKYYNVNATLFFDWKKYPVGTMSPSYYLRSIEMGNSVWVGFNRKISLFDNFGKVIVNLPELPQEPKFSPITGMSIYNNDFPIVVDNNNAIYAFDKSKNKWQFILSVNSMSNRHNRKIITRGLYADKRKKTLWITTESHGLLSVNMDTKRIERIQGVNGDFPTKNLISIRPDFRNRNLLWIGSSIGLISYNTVTKKSRVFTVDDGFPDNFIYSIYPDKFKNLWLGTNKGLVRFNTSTFKTRVFTKDHGISNLEFTYFQQLPLPGYKVAFGGLNNGVIFNPVSIIKEDTVSPVTALTDIKLNSKSLNLLRAGLVPVHNLKSLEVSHKENNISFCYSAFQFGEQEGNNYRYRLKGYDDDWVIAGIRREASYFKVPPGNYTFEVNATNKSNRWSSHICSIQVTILPPWWLNGWAITFYILAVTGIIIAYFKFRIRQEQIKNEIELKRIEADELRKLEVVKAKFFANIAHEFRTPLTLIQGPAEQLRKNGKDNEKLVGIISKNVSSLINLTDQLLDIAKLEAGVLKPQMVWGDVVTVISNIINAFAEEASAKDVSILLEAPKSADFLFSINTLDRILYNLLSNALKFSDPGGFIKVIVSKKENGLQLEVQDSGKGIPSNELDNVFNRYFRASNHSEKPGSGIGLSLVYELVELHEGTITVDSRMGISSGTTFSVWLPLAVQKILALPAEIAIVTNEADEKYTILLVEDHEDLAQFIANSLKEVYNVVIAKNGKEGLDIALNSMPDLIVSDVSMPEMNGFQFCNMVKQDMNLSHIPVILLTAKADIESRLEGLSFGANDYLTKPFSITELHLRIKNQLNLLRRLREKYHSNLTDPEKEVHKIECIDNDFLKKIYEVIDANLDNNDFSVEALADALFVSRANLQRKVKTLFNLSAGEIIKNYRLRKAAEFLNKGYTISEVVYITGFNTPSYFSKSFKDFYKVTPTEYIKK